MIASTHSYTRGRLSARPRNRISPKPIIKGLQPLGLAQERDALIYVPAKYDSNRKAIVVIMLHGAGGDAEHGMALLKHLADTNNLIVLAPASRDYSWDIIASRSFGPDVSLLDQAINYVFENFSIDSERIAIGGFSDGASYALSLGLINGDLFTDVFAFSPGFFIAPKITGSPSIFVSHGRSDNVLRIDPCARAIVQKLRKAKLEVDYREFNGAHELPMNICLMALKRLVDKRPKK